MWDSVMMCVCLVPYSDSVHGALCGRCRCLVLLCAVPTLEGGWTGTFDEGQSGCCTVLLTSGRSCQSKWRQTKLLRCVCVCVCVSVACYLLLSGVLVEMVNETM